MFMVSQPPLCVACKCHTTITQCLSAALWPCEIICVFVHCIHAVSDHADGDEMYKAGQIDHQTGVH